MNEWKLISSDSKSSNANDASISCNWVKILSASYFHIVPSINLTVETYAIPCPYFSNKDALYVLLTHVDFSVLPTFICSIA